jgi:hypothetical protein
MVAELAVLGRPGAAACDRARAPPRRGQDRSHLERSARAVRGLFASNSALVAKLDSAHLWRRWKPFVEEAIQAPLSMADARGELVEWWIDEAWRRQQERRRSRGQAIRLRRQAAARRPFGRYAARAFRASMRSDPPVASALQSDPSRVTNASSQRTAWLHVRGR